MSIMDSNARFEDEDRAMAEHLRTQAQYDEWEAELSDLYDNEEYPTPAQEKVMEADGRLEAAERYLDYLEWTAAHRDTVGHGFWGELGRAYWESIEARAALNAAVAAEKEQRND